MEDDGIKSWDGMPNTDSRIPVGTGHWRIYFLQARDTLDTAVYSRGRPILPTVWSDARLTRWEDRNPEDYANQAMNDPTTGEHMPLTKEQIDSLYIPRAAMRDIPIEYATLHLDTAFKEDQQEKGDYSVISVWLHDMRNNGMVYFDRSVFSNGWRVEQFNDELVAVMFDLRKRNIRVRMITDEPEPGGKLGSWKALVQQAIRGAGLRYVEIKQIPRQGTRRSSVSKPLPGSGPRATFAFPSITTRTFVRSSSQRRALPNYATKCSVSASQPTMTTQTQPQTYSVKASGVRRSSLATREMVAVHLSSRAILH